MAIQKKHGKGRLDKWYKLAKERGYRARAAFKLIQLNKKYGFLEESKVLLDLCAAPGSWMQVASQFMPKSSLIVGVDLDPIKPIAGAISFQSDITSASCRQTIRQHLKTWKADTVLHDGAPNVGTAWVQDAFTQAELALQALRLATDFLRPGGWFISKVFRSSDYNAFLWVCNQLFTKVEATKPSSSRNVSAEIFVVCKWFKAPKVLDPRLLDPKYVFAELKSGPNVNNEAKVYNPEVKKRKRDGYEEGDYTQFKEMAASEFIQTTDPIAVLASYNKITFQQPPNGDVALAAIDKLPETTDEIRNCCSDLRVLGRKDFKLLLKWRLKIRDIFQLKTPQAAMVEEPEEVAEVESMDEELKIQEELQNMKDRENTKRKREKRKENERKQREVVRMQLNMSTPFDIGLEESGPIGEGAMFSLKKVDKTDAMRRLNRGKMIVPTQATQKEADSGFGSSGETDDESDPEEDRLERELESMYDQYKERKAEVDAKYRAKKARKNFGDDEWDGLSGEEADEKDDSSELEEDDSSCDEDEAPTEGLIRDLDSSKGANGLSKRATAFFNQDIFSGISGILPEQEDAAEDSADEEVNRDAAAIVAQQAKNRKAEAPTKPTKTEAAGVDSDSEMEDNEDGFEVVKRNEDDDWDKDTRRADGRPDIDIITAEAMTLAHQLATGQKTSHDAIDDGFNKYAFRDRDGLPDWFVEDESRHDKLQKPISKAAAQAIKEKMRAFNARPIKKVREAKARKKFKAAQKLEKLKKKSELLNNDENMTEKEKADSISRLISRAAKKPKKQQAKLVVARGLNRGIKGRPKGVKGRYRIVDPRQKKELRAQKRIAKKKK
ncbi:hypothetical protein ACKLNR_001057 [Fusarium oxysporum f. sp. zingiberi]